MANSFLELRTLSFVLVLVTIILSAAMFFVWRKHKTYPGFGYWTISNLTAAIGFFLVGFRGTLPDLITVMMSNALVFGSLLLSLEGIRRFRGLAPQRLFSLGIIFVQMLLFAYFTYVDNSVITRIIIISLMNAVVCVLCAFELMRNVSQNIRHAYRQVGMIFVLAALFSFARLIFTYLFSDINDLFTPDWVQSLAFITAILFTIAWAFSYIILNSERMQQELQSTQSKLEKLATTDFLTGINNKRRFFEVCRDEIQHSKVRFKPLTVIIFDIDYFKKINDTFGHSAGDKVLINVIDVCRENLREMDFLGRLGGEEFAALLPDTDINTGRLIAERLRQSIENSEIIIASQIIQVTASFGASELIDRNDNIESLLERADAALYRAKGKGRNQVVLESPQISFETILQPQPITVSCSSR